MLELTRLIFQIVTKLTPVLIEERRRRQEIGLSNDALELAVLKHKDEIKDLPIKKVIAIGTRKAA